MWAFWQVGHCCHRGNLNTETLYHNEVVFDKSMVCASTVERLIKSVLQWIMKMRRTWWCPRRENCNWIFFYKRWYPYSAWHIPLNSATNQSHPHCDVHHTCLLILLQNNAAEQQSIRKGVRIWKKSWQPRFCLHPLGRSQNWSILVNLSVNDFVWSFEDGTNQPRSQADLRGNYRSKSISDMWLIPVEYSFVWGWGKDDMKY